jgi:hypothetical protein
VPVENVILIFSSLGEPCTQYVTTELQKFGANYFLINFEEALLDNVWSISVDIENAAVISISKQNGTYTLCKPVSVWMRRWGYPIYPALFDEFSTAFAFSEISSLVSSLPDVLKTAKWVNNQLSERSSSNKIVQLNIARELGFSIPKTLVTNDSTRVHEFLDSVGRVIFKPVSAFQPQMRRFNAPAQAKLGSHVNGIDLDFGKVVQDVLIFTQELTIEKIELLESIRWSPAIFQERIEKKADLRITVVGSRIFACRIASQGQPLTETDFRMMNISGLLPHTLIDLPGALENSILSLMRRLGLIFGCIDIIEARDGCYYFLEVNPVGQWLWIEKITGAPISKAIAQELTSAAKQ